MDILRSFFFVIIQNYISHVQYIPPLRAMEKLFCVQYIKKKMEKSMEKKIRCYKFWSNRLKTNTRKYFSSLSSSIARIVQCDILFINKEYKINFFIKWQQIKCNGLHLNLCEMLMNSLPKMLHICHQSRYSVRWHPIAARFSMENQNCSLLLSAPLVLLL